MRKALLTAAVLLSSVALDAAPPPKQKGPSLLKAPVTAAVPGIQAIFSLSEEQKAKLADIGKATLEGEDQAAARETLSDKTADRASKRAARKTLAQARRQFERVVKNHADSDWARLASQRLEEMERVSLPGHASGD